jgi:hypothetical protein
MPPFELLALPDEVTILSKPGIQVVWPKGSFYEREPLALATLPGTLKNYYCPKYEIEPSDIPVHFYFDIAIRRQQHSFKIKRQSLHCTIQSQWKLCELRRQPCRNNITSSARQMGTYSIMVDTIPPTITAYKFSPNMSTWKKMAFRIADNIGARDKAQDLRYSAWVDGQWILMALDGKTGILTHEFDGRIAPGHIN